MWPQKKGLGKASALWFAVNSFIFTEWAALQKSCWFYYLLFCWGFFISTTTGIFMGM